MKFSLTILLLSLVKIISIFGVILSFAYIFNHEHYPQDLNPWIIPISSTLILWLCALLLNYHIYSTKLNTKTPGGIFIKALDWSMGFILLIFGFANVMAFSSSTIYESTHLFDGLYLTIITTATTYSIIRVFFLSLWLNYSVVPNEKIIQYGKFLILPGQKFFFMPTMLWWGRLQINKNRLDTGLIEFKNFNFAKEVISFKLGLEVTFKRYSDLNPKEIQIIHDSAKGNTASIIADANNFINKAIRNARLDRNAKSIPTLIEIILNRFNEYSSSEYTPVIIKKIKFEQEM